MDRYASALAATGGGGVDVCGVSCGGLGASSGELSELFLLMGYGGVYFRAFDTALQESFSAISRWTVLGLVYLGAVWLLWRHSLSAHRPNPMVADMWALMWIAAVSALAYSSLVEPVWMRSSVRRWLRHPILGLHTLDEFAEARITGRALRR